MRNAPSPSKPKVGCLGFLLISGLFTAGLWAARARSEEKGSPPPSFSPTPRARPLPVAEGTKAPARQSAPALRPFVERAREARILGQRDRAFEALRRAAEKGEGSAVISEAIAASALPGLELDQLWPLLENAGPKGPIRAPISDFTESFAAPEPPGLLWAARHGFTGDGRVYVAALRREGRIWTLEQQRGPGSRWRGRSGALQGLAIVAAESGERLGFIEAESFALSPSSSAIALSDGERVWLWNPLTRRTEAEFPGWSRPLFHPSGAALLLHKGDACELRDLGSKALMAGPFRGRGLGFLDARTVVLRTGPERVEARDIETGDALSIASEQSIALGPHGVFLDRRRSPLSFRARFPDRTVSIGRFHQARVGPGLAYSPSRRLFALRPEALAPVVEVWSVETGARTRALYQPGGGDLNLRWSAGVFHPSGDLLAVEGGPGETPDHRWRVNIWDVRTGQVLRQIPACSDPVWSPDGSTLATLSHSPDGPGAIRLYKVKADRATKLVTGAPVWSLLAGAGRVAVGERLYELRGATLEARSRGLKPAWTPFHIDALGGVWSASFTPRFPPRGRKKDAELEIERLDPDGGRRVFALPIARGREPELRLWRARSIALDLERGRAFLGLEVDPLQGPGSTPFPALFEQWDLKEGRCLSSVALSSWPGRIRVGYSREAEVFLASGGDGLALFDGETGAFRLGLAFFKPRAWLEDGEPEAPILSQALQSFGFSHRFPEPATVTAFAISGDGRRAGLVIQHDDERRWLLCVLDLAENRLVGLWPASKTRLSSVALDSTGRRLYSAGRDRRIRVWDPDGMRELVSWEAHDRAVTSLLFSPPGRLISADAEGRVKLWELAKIRGDLAKIGLDWE